MQRNISEHPYLSLVAHQWAVKIIKIMNKYPKFSTLTSRVVCNTHITQLPNAPTNYAVGYRDLIEPFDL